MRRLRSGRCYHSRSHVYVSLSLLPFTTRPRYSPKALAGEWVAVCTVILTKADHEVPGCVVIDELRSPTTHGDGPARGCTEVKVVADLDCRRVSAGCRVGMRRRQRTAAAAAPAVGAIAKPPLYAINRARAVGVVRGRCVELTRAGRSSAASTSASRSISSRRSPPSPAE